MTQRELIVLLLVVCGGWATPGGSGAAEPPRPNIVLILADDLGYGDLSCNNADSRIRTPVLDRLAAEGMNFTDAHTPSGVCSPTRYGLLTGRYAWRTRLKRGVLKATSPPLIEKDRLTLPKMLVGKGYATGAFGKWHLGRRWQLRDSAGKVTVGNIDWSHTAEYCPLDAGFTYLFGLAKPGWAFMENRNVLSEPTEHFDLTHVPPKIIGPNNNRGYRQPGFTFEKMLPAWVEKTKRFIRENAEIERQFFVYFAPICPHRPIYPNKQFQGTSECGVFGDFVQELDWSVGEILKTLEETGCGEETLVVFTADNGAEINAYDHVRDYGHWSSGGLRGCKRDLYEGGHHVPFIARWRHNIPAGKRSDEIICLTDLLATIAAVIDFDLPQESGEDSYNILPVLKGETLDRPIREATVHHSAKGNFALRQGDWVYIDAPSGSDSREPPFIRKQLGVQPHAEKTELFNLADDPRQTVNLVRKHPEIAARMKAILRRYQSSATSLPR